MTAFLLSNIQSPVTYCDILYMYSTVQYSAVQYSTVQYSTVQYTVMFTLAQKCQLEHACIIVQLSKGKGPVEWVTFLFHSCGIPVP